MIDIIKKKMCSGCQVCASVCPNSAIAYKYDKEGFLYPIADENKCTSCGKCINFCLKVKKQDLERYKAPTVYLAWSIKDEIRMNSASGGIFYTLASCIIEQGGSVAGCRWNEDYKGARHEVVHDIAGLKSLMGTKYVQSDMSEIYSAIKCCLQNGQEVLFCGTPCQNAAVKKYVGTDNEKLYCIDLFCHGVGTPGVFKKYISDLEEKNHSKIRKIHQRDKQNGWNSLGSNIEFENGKKMLKDKKQDWWMKGFLANLFLRPSCHRCQYKGFPRVGDISIGDFWKVSGVKEVEMYKGISAVLINSPKGEKLWKMIVKDVYFKEKSIQELLIGNQHILKSADVNPNRKRFFNDIRRMTFSEAVKKNTKQKYVVHIKNVFEELKWKK